MDVVLDSVPARVTAEMNNGLTAPYTPNEVKNALFQMYPTKAPGPDGYPAHFFQRHWELCGTKVTNVVLRILRGEESPERSSPLGRRPAADPAPPLPPPPIPPRPGLRPPSYRRIGPSPHRAAPDPFASASAASTPPRPRPPQPRPAPAASAPPSARRHEL
nr:basic proline-rich protein-like [Aegilops tauschii subsp. strangulata]